MHHVQASLAGADHRETPFLDCLEQTQETQVAFAVDRAGPHDRDRLTALGGCGRRELGFELRALIDVARAKSIGFIGRRPIDVSMHAAGGAMHDAFAAVRARGRENVQCSADVDVPIELVRVCDAAERRRQVVNARAAFGRATHVGRIRELAFEGFDSGVRESRRPRFPGRTSARTWQPPTLSARAK